MKTQKINQINLKVLSLSFETLTLSSINKTVFNCLNDQDKLTVFIFLVKRGFICQKLDESISFSKIDSIIKNNQLTFLSCFNEFSLLDTILNKIFKKCYSFYMTRMDYSKLKKIIPRSSTYFKNRNKLFWLLFFFDCFNDNDKVPTFKEFHIFFKSFAAKTHISRKKTIKKANNKYLNIVLRNKTIQTWIFTIKKNKIFLSFLYQVKDTIVKEFLLNTNIDQATNDNIDKQFNFNSIFNVKELLQKCLDKIITYQKSPKFKLNPRIIKKDLMNLKCPSALNDYLYAFSLI